MSNIRQFMSGSGYTETWTTSGTSTVPTWAKFVRVWMTGGGGSGTHSITTSANRRGGGSSAALLGLPMPLAGASTISVTVGAGGAAQTTSNSNGITGGDSEITIASRRILTQGGQGGLANTQTLQRNVLAFYTASLSVGLDYEIVTGSPYVAPMPARFVQCAPPHNSQDIGQGGPFGNPSSGTTIYGYGHGGGASGNVSRAGAPGIVILEYV
jgi:hypothetical protein